MQFQGLSGCLDGHRERERKKRKARERESARERQSARERKRESARARERDREGERQRQRASERERSLTEPRMYNFVHPRPYGTLTHFDVSTLPNIATASEAHSAWSPPLPIHTCIYEAPPSSDTFSGSPVA